ncbi:aldose epimerase family protein [Actinacidiphila yeochonensis]|uniref:aldose epimerase family protein n=1 Tax=Actinacidiphila yeochonensis TaxID=89050 RepID=UPI00055A4820|nr:aldose epimerase family protein [Actinacidiphila yeochonensis]
MVVWSGEPFGDVAGVERWSAKAGCGVEVEVLTYGGILHALRVPDERGRLADVVLSLPDLESYQEVSPYFGALIGRYGNRIAGGTFTLDGETYTLPANDRGQTLHGGPEGFDRRVWAAEALPDGAGLRLSLVSPDGDMGFPGEVRVTAVYALDDDGTLSLDFEAHTDRATVLNLTSHAYFNLAGAGSGDVLSHTLRVDGDAYLPIDAVGIPDGPPLPVRGTAFDLTRARGLRAGVASPDRQVRAVDGFDHCWVLREAPEPGAARTAAVLHDPESGRTLEVRTSEPGLQVYTANSLDGSLTGPDGHRYGPHGAVCLEPQHFPDSPNRADFPSTVLRPGEVLRSRMELRFPHLSAEADPVDGEGR